VKRIEARFRALKSEGRGALIPYLQAYDPDLETSLALLRGMPAAGADLIEIGVPFSDPSADGPTIQAAALRGLKAGATLAGVLDMVRRFREEDNETPIILMGYLNPIDSYGPARFCAEAAAVGVDGLIIVDMPPEESDLLADDAARHGLDIIRLVAPNSDAQRLAEILPDASGFIYYVSITGITGTRTASEAELAAAIPAMRAVSDLPIAIGFGISTPGQARIAARTGDAAVVASALIKMLHATLQGGQATKETVSTVLTQLRTFSDALRP